MCTAISDRTLFGRTLDLECSYGETPLITPEQYSLPFLYEPPLISKHRMVGMACSFEGFPLYYDAVNDAGLAMAALNFPQTAVYHQPKNNHRNLASFELIPYLLGQCSSRSEALRHLRQINITPDSVSPALPATPLHWLLADAEGATAIESTADGLQLYENSVGVLTNSPSFPNQMLHLADFMALDVHPPKNRICPAVPLATYSRGMGALGMPGDWSSASRLVRAVFSKTHTMRGKHAQEEISRFFHIMDTVAQPCGCAVTETGAPIFTVYTSCADLTCGAYYFTTYRNRRIRAVSLWDAPKGSQTLFKLPLGEETEDICFLSPNRMT